MVIGCTMYFGADLWDAGLDTDGVLVYNHSRQRIVMDYCPFNLMSLCEMEKQVISMLEPELQLIAFALSHVDDSDSLEQSIRCHFSK